MSKRLRIVTDFMIIISIITIIGLAEGAINQARGEGATTDSYQCRTRQPHMPQIYCVKLRTLSVTKLEKYWVLKDSTAQLLKHESSFRWDAVNPRSHACGIGQMLPCLKFGSSYPCWRKDVWQVRCFWRYLEGRYRTPDNAWNFWKRHYWW